MRNHKNALGKTLLLGAALLALSFPASVSAAAAGSLLSVTEESQILPLPDGTGKYLLKSDGFYCLNEDGTKENKPAIHYFDHFVIDGTVFDGLYYHDEEGKFKAGNPHMVRIRQLSVPDPDAPEGDLTATDIFDGYFMVNNLGRLTAAPQIRYMDNLVIDGVTFNGYYYFDENGQMVTDTGIHYIEMDSNGQHFQGSYYFGGINGVLLQENGVTPEGLIVDGTGKVQNMDELGIENLKPQLDSLISGYDGEWSIYVKDLNTEEEVVINNKRLYSASLIKPFVMAKTYENMETVKEHEAARINSTPDSNYTLVQMDDLLFNMIAVSDNESCNELVRLQSDKSDFGEGAESINEYLEEEGYTDTSIQHTLHPSSSQQTGLGGRNTTSVKDCGLLLERIYKGECVSREASREMLDLLLSQEVTWKIPEGLSGDIKVANKTGETDTDQHDIAIVYGEKTNYILCVMSENCPDENTAINNIRSISKLVYNYLNL
ncbi:MAG: serine hydrolase [Eubacteriales bacterium]|nr:serine hydrolase [Eubacteriales bacterium]